MAMSARPRIGMLWGNFSGSGAPTKFAQLWSMARVARDVTRALSMFGEVIPFCPPPDEDISSMDIVLSKKLPWRMAIVLKLV